MTTIIKCGDLLAVDGTISRNETIISRTADKVVKNGEDSFAMMGYMSNMVAKAKEANAAIMMYRKGEVCSNRAFEKCDACICKVNTEEGWEFYVVESNDEGQHLMVSLIEDKMCAWGHGGELAYGALQATKNLNVAMDVVNKYDPFSGGEWQIC